MVMQKDRWVFVAQARLLKLLGMIEYLKSEPRTRKEILERFDMNSRTFNRYLNIIEAADLGLKRPSSGGQKNYKYFIIKEASALVTKREI